MRGRECDGAVWGCGWAATSGEGRLADGDLPVMPHGLHRDAGEGRWLANRQSGQVLRAPARSRAATSRTAAAMARKSFFRIEP